MSGREFYYFNRNSCHALRCEAESRVKLPRVTGLVALKAAFTCGHLLDAVDQGPNPTPMSYDSVNVASNMVSPDHTFSRTVEHVKLEHDSSVPEFPNQRKSAS